MLRTFDYKCPSCGLKETRLVEQIEIDQQICSCGIATNRVFSSPNVRTEKLSKSFIDGQRGRSAEFQALKRQGQLEYIIEDQWASREDKTEAKKELNKISGEIK